MEGSDDRCSKSTRGAPPCSIAEVELSSAMEAIQFWPWSSVAEIELSSSMATRRSSVGGSGWRPWVGSSSTVLSTTLLDFEDFKVEYLRDKAYRSPS
ncbi:hypothetical protein NL676_035844 [Syzygium grande]|nr:hypothetical protein NL676_035844 [Syzygium grande]